MECLCAYVRNFNLKMKPDINNVMANTSVIGIQVSVCRHFAIFINRDKLTSDASKRAQLAGATSIMRAPRNNGRANIQPCFLNLSK